MVNGERGITDTGSWLPHYKKALRTSYQDRKQAFFFFHPLATVAGGFQIRPHQFHCSTTQTWLYNSHFMVCYLPNWLIELKHLAHTQSISNLAVLILALLVIVVQREGVEHRGGWEGGQWQGRLIGNYFPPCIAATSPLAFATCNFTCTRQKIRL